MREEIFELLEQIDEERDLECKSRIEALLKENGITNMQVSVDEMFDSPGYDVYSVAVAWVEDGTVQLAVGSIGID